MSIGQRGSANPAAMLSSLINKRERLQEELRNIEKQVYELETNYLQDSNHFGHALKGFEGFLSSSKNTANLKRSRKFQPEDRLFSLSSVTSHAAEDLGVRQDDRRSDFGPGRSSHQRTENQRREELSARDGKRMRPSSEADFDDEDDLDLSLK